MTLTKRQKQLRVHILDTIYSQGPISRIDISQATGITPATVSEITNQLIDTNLIKELGEDNDSQVKSGRKKILLAVKPKHSYYIGTELSEKFFTFVLCDNTNKVIDSYTVLPELPTPLTEMTFHDTLRMFYQKVSQQYKIENITIALPGHFDSQHKRILSNNPLWMNFDFSKVITELNMPVYFENNVKIMVIRERLFNPTVQAKNISVLHIGRGMFCSSIYLQQLYAPDSVTVGEIGHLIVHPDGEMCECGKRGCLQTYASEAWLLKKAAFLYNNSESTYLRQLATSSDVLTIQHVLKAYHLGDEGVTNMLHSALKYLGIIINNLSMMIASDSLIIHGELFKEEQLKNLLTEHINDNIRLLSSSSQLAIQFKPFQKTNGAIAACAYGIQKNLLEYNKSTRSK